MPMFLFFMIGKIFTIIFGLYYLKVLSIPYKLTLILVTLAAFCECYGYYISIFQHMSNLWLFNIYLIAEEWLLGVAAIYLVSNIRTKTWFMVLLIVNSIFWIYTITVYSLYI